ncbi:coadhesin-like [Babylonia areolata]|uniref:coadhesin-like n=1 Tax=Babylonia areolata TaxID=304850 RepID=UPI003FD2E8B4
MTLGEQQFVRPARPWTRQSDSPELSATSLHVESELEACSQGAENMPVSDEPVIKQLDNIHGWTAWSRYGRCSKTCGTGNRRRTRTCRGAGTGCSYLCSGPKSGTESCGTQQCCDESSHGWTAWAVNRCTQTCGGGLKRYSRRCKGQGTSCSRLCEGSSTKEESCNTQTCCVDSIHGWNAWSRYGRCSKTCGTGTRRRTRSCRGAGTDCSYLCSGPDSETGRCGTQQCCDDNTHGWTTWSQYGRCSKTCGTGTRQRTRTCKGAGTDCSYLCADSNSETANCQIQECCELSTHGWAGWTVTITCTKTCGGGLRRYTRQCKSRGTSCSRLCDGSSTKEEPCKTQTCCDQQTHGWTDWSQYSRCSKTCGSGTRRRTRICKGDGTDCSHLCSGANSETVNCKNEECCVDSEHGWTAWSSFGRCSQNCGEGTQQRSRRCRASGTSCARLCVGSYTDSRECTVEVARNGGWSEWRDEGCSATCGSGIISLTRTCTNPAPNDCGRQCSGNSISYKPCTGLISCCQEGRQTGASITLSQQSVTVESDPNAAGIGVIMTCQAVTCPGDTVKRIVLGKVVASNTIIDYVTAETGFSGGQALDNINRPHTQVSGSIAQSSLTYVLTKIRCEDAGTYRCSTNIKKHKKGIEKDSKTAAITVKVNPGRFSVTPLVPINNLKVGDVLLLNCSGSVGTITPDTQWLGQY